MFFYGSVCTYNLIMNKTLAKHCIPNAYHVQSYWQAATF